MISVNIHIGLLIKSENVMSSLVTKLMTQNIMCQVINLILQADLLRGKSAAVLKTFFICLSGNEGCEFFDDAPLPPTISGNLPLMKIVMSV